ncbi:hypothetical protein Val02_76870 [Virgisporangium aliadipatigenens]|uniref:Uncharacterized protein n=1 Tax=Virgisporangium aliadipatigenens TaxID=741659 RepID=A0A8J4DUV4_9ACTN|nr:hypothetical protein Val02_76870 [Virgisporangium aliadipatigenens]
MSEHDTGRWNSRQGRWVPKEPTPERPDFSIGRFEETGDVRGGRRRSDRVVDDVDWYERTGGGHHAWQPEGRDDHPTGRSTDWSERSFRAGQTDAGSRRARRYGDPDESQAPPGRTDPPGARAPHGPSATTGRSEYKPPSYLSSVRDTDTGGYTGSERGGTPGPRRYTDSSDDTGYGDTTSGSTASGVYGRTPRYGRGRDTDDVTSTYGGSRRAADEDGDAEAPRRGFGDSGIPRQASRGTTGRYGGTAPNARTSGTFSRPDARTSGTFPRPDVRTTGSQPPIDARTTGGFPRPDLSDELVSGAAWSGGTAAPVRGARPAARADDREAADRRDYDDEPPEAAATSTYAASVLATFLWFLAPAAIYAFYIFQTDSTVPATCDVQPCQSQRDIALIGVAGFIPWVVVALALGAATAVGLRYFNAGWRAMGTGFAAATIGSGLATLLNTFLSS